MILGDVVRRGPNSLPIERTHKRGIGNIRKLFLSASLKRGCIISWWFVKTWLRKYAFRAAIKLASMTAEERPHVWNYFFYHFMQTYDKSWAQTCMRTQVKSSSWPKYGLVIGYVQMTLAVKCKWNLAPLLKIKLSFYFIFAKFIDLNFMWTYCASEPICFWCLTRRNNEWSFVLLR